MKKLGILATFVTLPVLELAYTTTLIADTDASSYWFIGGSGGGAYG